MQLDENVTLGLDIGIGSLGWALVRSNPETGAQTLVSKTTMQGEVLTALGVRLFSVPEDAKTKEPLNVHRRQARMARRVIKRRAQRMRHIRTLLAQYGMGAVRDVEKFHLTPQKAQISPWILRQQGLSRLLTSDEWATVLIHIAKHRGFRSNSKSDKADKDTGKMLSAMGNFRAEFEQSGVPTIGAYLADKPAKRNRKQFHEKSGYQFTLFRSDLETEVDTLFAKQRELGSDIAAETLQSSYKTLAFQQRPLASTAELVGPCAFEPLEKRAPRFAPTAERFRLAQTLAHLRLRVAQGQIRPLTPEEIQQVYQTLGSNKGITYKTVRKQLKLPSSITFDGLAYGDTQKKDPEATDIVTRTGDCGKGTYTLREILGETHFASLNKLRENDTNTGFAWNCLDRVIKIVSDNDDIETIQKSLASLPLTPQAQSILNTAVEGGKFAFCRGVMNLSVKAMEAILPHLLQGLNYAAACEQAGYDHTCERKIDTSAIRNPVVQSILREVRRQTTSIIHEFNVMPGRVHIELLRDVGKSPDERKKINNGMRERTSQKEKLRAELAHLFNIEPDKVRGTELMRYELWKAQGGRCAYHMLWKNAGGSHAYQGALAQGQIPVDWLRDEANATQIDHILPRSRTFDNSFHNLCLCCTAANQAKGGQTPYEWIGKNNPDAWHDFSTWVRSLPIKGLKKRNFLLENLDAEVQGRFHARNLTDSRYASRLIAHWFREEYQRHGIADGEHDSKEPRRVFARPGAVTDFLRRSWGVQALKKDSEGNRTGDQHHALDALIVACCSEGLLQRITKLFQQAETQHSRVHIPYPWPTFREDAKRAVGQVFVSRVERGKTSGALHEETLRAIRQEKDEAGKDITMLYERCFVDPKSFTAEKLAAIKDPKRCPEIIAALQRWLADGKPADNPPRTLQGDIIRHIRVKAGKFTSGIVLQRGSGKAQANNGSIVRTDVYTKGGKFYLVPVYAKDVADGRLPIRACVAKKSEDKWPLMDDSYTFCFSLRKDCFVRIKSKKQEIEGYFDGTNKATMSITLSAAYNRQDFNQGIGVKTLLMFEKYRIDRLGRRHLVTKEPDPRKSHV